MGSNTRIRERTEAGEKIQEEPRNIGVQDLEARAQEKENVGTERRKVKWLTMEMAHYGNGGKEEG